MPKVKNIVIVNDFAFVNGGAGKVAISTALELANRDYRVIMFTAVGPICEELSHSKVEVICTNQYDILSDPNRIRAIVQGVWNMKSCHAFGQLLQSLDPKETVVHFHTWIKSLSASLFEVTARRKFKIIITLHDFFIVCPNGGLFNYQKKKICELKPMSCSCILCHCDARNYYQKLWRCVRLLVQKKVMKKNKDIHVIEISKLNGELMRSNWKSDVNWHYVKNPIEFISFPLINVYSNEFYLFVGRLSSEKGCELFCQAITELNLKGCVLGDGYLRDKLQADYPNIYFAGWVSGEKKLEWMKKTKALIFPSLWYETFGLSVAEAKFYGIPCIVPDKCAASEQVEDGNTGYIFKTGNLQSLKESILKYENTDIRWMQNNIIKTFDKDVWSMKSHIRCLEEAYHQIMINQNERSYVE